MADQWSREDERMMREQAQVDRIAAAVRKQLANASNGSLEFDIEMELEPESPAPSRRWLLIAWTLTLLALVLAAAGQKPWQWVLFGSWSALALRDSRDALAAHRGAR